VSAYIKALASIPLPAKSVLQTRGSSRFASVSTDAPTSTFFYFIPFRPFLRPSDFWINWRMGNLLLEILDLAAIQRSFFNILPRILVIIAKSRVGEKLLGVFSRHESDRVPDITNDVHILSCAAEACGGFADVYFGEWKTGDVTRQVSSNK